MARVAVVGGGFGGIAVAARLARSGHRVTLLERAPGLGGALSWIERDGFGWDAGAATTLLPAVLRDLFRATGRPLERELDLVALPVVREHRFPDGSRVSVPGGSRAAQLASFETLGPGLGRAWCDHVAAYAGTWELLRRDYLERPYDPSVAPGQLRALLAGRETLARRLRRLPDPRLRAVAAHPVICQGHDARRAPGWAGLDAYLEQRFGAWTVPGGLARLVPVLEARLRHRGVTVLTGSTVRDLVLRAGRAVAVATDGGELDTDLVVCAVDPGRLPALAAHVRVTTPAPLPRITHLGLASGAEPSATRLPGAPREPEPAGGRVPPPELVLHGDPMLVLRTGGRAPEGAAAWTVLARGRDVDVVAALERRGVRAAGDVVVRLDRSPAELAAAWGGSPYGVAWRGRSTLRHRPGPATPVPGVYAAGAHATPGPGLPFVGLSAALVAQAVGPA